ncbi:protein of unknown function [Cupriavidus taiwanensis]|uniref:Uncharacterized protein n=1 Tax=Cupriavidus taiwanensis TaxID=164546 RepID=A0A7Z7NJE6_9BURK|nr:protein of unknown function [Cupriavidus taiwanensis]SOZ02903.1 hypothetical protein CBM2597_A10226 [Cupriavidus taiwanensis]SPC06317.1 hypothetical protein CBM2594_A10228 [Cupriavidus taiwanensis]SPD38296.1 protein of unknown function [Cupriavidus taiwanensis]
MTTSQAVPPAPDVHRAKVPVR